MTDLPRTSGLDRSTFSEQHLAVRAPVVVTDEVPRWRAFREWTLVGLADRFGDHEVDVFDDWFVPTGSIRFRDFVHEVLGDRGPDRRRSYVRWFSRHRPGPGRWADDVFAAIEQEWMHPSFLPIAGYTVPAGPSAGGGRTVTRDLFPYRGLFVSAPGAGTRLHRDPWASSAMLCQVAGTKHVRMFAPDQEDELVAAVGRGQPCAPRYEGGLGPGEALFVPDGWWHDVETLSASISITWNFVHGSSADRFRRHLATQPDDPELDVAAFLGAS